MAPAEPTECELPGVPLSEEQEEAAVDQILRSWWEHVECTEVQLEEKQDFVALACLRFSTVRPKDKDDVGHLGL